MKNKTIEEINKQKARLSFLKRASLNMAPLTGIAVANNWLINKLNLNFLSVKTTKQTTLSYTCHSDLLSVD